VRLPDTEILFGALSLRLTRLVIGARATVGSGAKQAQPVLLQCCNQVNFL